MNVDPTRAEAPAVQAARLPALEPTRRAIPPRRRPQVRETGQDPKGPLRPLRPRDRLHPLRPLPPRGPAPEALPEAAPAPLPLRAAGALRPRPAHAPPPRSPAQEPGHLLDAHRREERTQGRQMTAILALVLAFSPEPAVTRGQASTHAASQPLAACPAGSGTAASPRARTYVRAKGIPPSQGYVREMVCVRTSLQVCYHTHRYYTFCAHAYSLVV